MSGYRLIVGPQVEEDLTEAAQWYQRRASGLGARFLDEVEATLEVLERNPKLYQVVHRDTRRAPLPGFPFGVFYRLREDDTIKVLAVMHLARQPSRWKQRED